LKRRVWQAPVIAMILSVFVGTLVFHLIALVALRFIGNPMNWFEAMNLVTLPSLLLNIILAIPAYAVMGELADWLYPEELEV
jgi:uncharacterized PurR-regulated membrane protein YhhQ (DUF165 family)